MKVVRSQTLTQLIAFSLVLVPAIAMAQTNQNPVERTVPLKVSDTDRAAASNYSNLRIHILPRLGATPTVGVKNRVFTANPSEAQSEKLYAGAENSASSLSTVPSPGFYPADLTYHGGAVVKTAQSHNIYVDAPSSTWANPANFILDFQKSVFVHTLDQYIGETSDNRYTVGAGGVLNYPIFTTLGNNDLVQMVYASAAALGSGYGNIYHIYLPPGVDFCEPNGVCYSPDNLATFSFCAFHASITFSDIGHVLFSLEPYQNVQGCATEQPSPNGPIKDSTFSVLSHELSETITDPDGDAWTAQSSLAVFGDEIGDLCSAVDLTGPYFKNPISDLNGEKYEIQMEYSNTYHACANRP